MMSDEPRMTGMDKEIFNATRTLTSLLNDACNHWNYLCPYLERLAVVADDALRGYQKDYPEQVAELIDYRRERDSRGNAAAMREACANIAEYARTARCHTDDAHVLGYLEQIEKWAESALSAPARNCDLYKNKKDAEAAFISEECKHPCGNCTVNDEYGCALVHECGVDWLLAPAAERKGEGK